MNPIASSQLIAAKQQWRHQNGDGNSLKSTIFGKRAEKYQTKCHPSKSDSTFMLPLVQHNSVCRTQKLPKVFVTNSYIRLCCVNFSAHGDKLTQKKNVCPTSTVSGHDSCAIQSWVCAKWTLIVWVLGFLGLVLSVLLFSFFACAILQPSCSLSLCLPWWVS